MLSEYLKYLNEVDMKMRYLISMNTRCNRSVNTRNISLNYKHSLSCVKQYQVLSLILGLNPFKCTQ